MHHDPFFTKARIAKASLYGLKTANLAVITLNSFALVFVLVRVLPLEFYPLVVIVVSLGNYVLATDLGYSGFVYATVRKSYLQDRLEEKADFVAEAVNVYAVVAIAAALVAAVFIVALVRSPSFLNVTGLAVYFFSICLALPWTLVRRAAAAMDLFVQFELLELIRRTVMVALVACMLAGLSFLAFALLSVAVWGAAILVAAMAFRGRGISLQPRRPAALFRHITSNAHNFSRAGGFTFLEFALFNFPYLALPLMMGLNTQLVVFDLFYKIVRFGNVAFGVANETLLPSQTRAYHMGAAPQLRRYTVQVMLLGAMPLLLAVAFIELYGERFFEFLLNGIEVGADVRLAMTIMLAGLLLQTSAVQFLVGIAQYRQLIGRAAGAVVAMAAMCAAVVASSQSFSVFMLLYAGVFAGYGLVIQGALWRSIAHLGSMNRADSSKE